MLYEAIKSLYPNILDNQVLLQDDGAGPYIKKWTYTSPVPTMTQIQAEATRLKTQKKIPVEVDMSQARLALLKKGHLHLVNDYINGLTGIEGESSRIEWEFRQRVNRSHPLVTTIKDILQLTDQELDELFILANIL